MSFHNPYISYFARVDFRDDNRLVGIYQWDRMVGMYILGKTGTGKTNLLERLTLQDITQNRGVCVIDMHGDMVRKIKGLLTQGEAEKCIYLDIADEDLAWGYNPLRKVSYEKRHLIASHIIETFQKIWGANAWGVKLEHILRNVLLTLLDQDTMSFSDIPRLFSDMSFRSKCVEAVVSEEVKRFWLHEFPKFGKNDLLPILNKIGSFLTIPCVKRLLVENKKQLSLFDIMNSGKILLINLSKGAVGGDAAGLLGSLFLGGISAAGFHRVNIPEIKRKRFFVYLDEFHNFTTLSLVNMFSELRKYGLGFILAHQYLNQLNTQIKDAVLGNIGTIICFRLSYQDAKYMAQEFYPVFTAHDFISLENYHIYLKLMIDGKPSHGFSAITLKSSR